MPQHHSWGPLRVPRHENESIEHHQLRSAEIERIVNGFRMSRYSRTEAERLERRLDLLRHGQSKKPASSSLR